VQKLIRTLSDSDLLPVIVFSFARRECEGYAAALNDIDFSDRKPYFGFAVPNVNFLAEEKHLIREIFTNSIYGLSEDDKQLPSVSGILPYLERGIGIHHSGLLPILKEVIEMMFGEGLIKV
jgi:ATP-dependent RNA helicase DOB1